MLARVRRQSGFTLIEVIVVAAIIAILAAILVPMIIDNIAESRKSRAQGDCKTIYSGIISFKKDVGKWPYYKDPLALANPTNPGNGYTLLHTGETTDLPTIVGGTGFDTSSPTRLRDQLTLNDSGYATTGATAWKGPYVSELGLDPWDRSYIVNSSNFDSDPTLAPTMVWVISAGPDRQVCTFANTDQKNTVCPDGITPNDDIVFRIK